jgi:hypothetical protein
VSSAEVIRRATGVAVAGGVGAGVAVGGTAVGVDVGTGVTEAVGLVVGVADGEDVGTGGGVGVGVGAAATTPLAIQPPMLTTSRKASAVPIAHCMSRLLLATTSL